MSKNKKIIICLFALAGFSTVYSGTRRHINITNNSSKTLSFFTPDDSTKKCFYVHNIDPIGSKSSGTVELEESAALFTGCGTSSKYITLDIKGKDGATKETSSIKVGSEFVAPPFKDSRYFYVHNLSGIPNDAEFNSEDLSFEVSDPEPASKSDELVWKHI